MTSENSKNLIRSYQGLSSLLHQQGLFQASWIHSVLEPALALFIWIGAYVWVAPLLPWTAGALLTLSTIHLVWWIHDVGHLAHFRSEKLSQIVSEVIGVFVLGMPQIEYHFEIHRRHHRFANLLGKDTALNTGPVVWHASQMRSGRDWLLRIQPLIWLFLVLPCTYPLLTLQSIGRLIKRPQAWRILLLGGRWVAIFVLVGEFFWLIWIPPWIAGFILGLSASLNHFHKTIYSESLGTPVARVFYTTQNVWSQSRFFGWLTGGLSCHIEHHLFPTMPRRNLRAASHLVRKFAHVHKLPYDDNDAYRVLKALWQRLSNPEPSQCKKDSQTIRGNTDELK